MIKSATNIPAEQLTSLKAVIRSATPYQLREAVAGLEPKPVAGSRGQSAPPRLELRELATPNSYAWAELRHLAFPVQRGRGQNSVILTIHAEMAAVIAQRLTRLTAKAAAQMPPQPNTDSTVIVNLSEGHMSPKQLLS